MTYVETLMRYGILILFGWVFAVQAGMPIPTAPLLMAIGALGRLGKLSPPGAVLAALGGSIVADLLWYGIGRRWSGRIVRVAATGRAHELFLAHRLWALVIGEFIFEVNAAVALLAGSAGIRVGEFLVYGIEGAAVWAGVWVGVGHVLQVGMNEAATTAASFGEWFIVEIGSVLGGVPGREIHQGRRGIHAPDGHGPAPVLLAVL